MLKSFKLRIYPTDKQKVLLSKHFGCRRFVWNYFLNKRKEAYLNEKKNLTYNQCSAQLTQLKKMEEYKWLSEVNAQSLQQSLRDLDSSYNKFFRKTCGFPKFKSKGNSESYRIPQHIKIIKNKLIIRKFNCGIRLCSKKIEGKIKSVTISKVPSGKYFASILCEVGDHKKLVGGGQIGVDLGLKEFSVCSNGDRFVHPKHYHQLEKKLKYRSRQLSKKKKGSKSRNRQRIKLALVYEKIANQRKDFLHKLSTKLINENQVICVESLNIFGMVKNHCLAKSISNSGWGEFVRQLKYKSEWYGRTLVEIDRFFPSSKTCHDCGWINQDLKLKDREWTCQCGKMVDRDLNASKNILKQGLNLLSSPKKKSGLGTKSLSKQKQVEASSMDESMKPDVLA